MVPSVHDVMAYHRGVPLDVVVDGCVASGLLRAAQCDEPDCFGCNALHGDLEQLLE